MNTFSFRKVFVSPHRRTIETAVLMLSSHPQKSQITLILLPLAKENLHTSSDLPVPFAELLAFTDSLHA
jgi:phosphohistidine phosphatase SixA